MDTKELDLKYYDITSKWGNAEFCREFECKIDSWLKQFKEDEAILMLRLLRNFYYYTDEKFQNEIKALYKKFADEYCDKEKEACYFRIENTANGVGFSDIAFSTFWLKNTLKDRSSNKLLELIEGGVCPKVICIVDDYAGTGNTFIKYMNKLININHEVRDSTVFFLVLHISEVAVEKIREASQEKGVTINIVYCDISSKSFDGDRIFDKKEREFSKCVYNKICISKNINKLAYGYKDVQALVSFHYNTPNNTLGIFWLEIEDFFSLFSRYKGNKSGLKEMIRRAKNNKDLNKKPIIIFADCDDKLKKLMVYCISKGDDFSFDSAISDLGLTSKQLDEYINQMYMQGFIKFERGKIVASELLQKTMFEDRLASVAERKEDFSYDVSGKFDEANYIPKDFEKIFKGYK